MQDRFKYRAINKKTKEIIYINDYYWFEANGICEIENNEAIGFLDEYWIDQCTGLKDKNGKLIYEGDVVYKKGSKNWKNEKLLSKVIWSSNSAAFMISDENGLHQMPMNSHNIEILGNIYETPELIGGE